ncbi:hypothetical protein [Liquorilactobacillus satsumensis]|uniref:hypothetical protein n=1 Tax=Liquorilactobacillus TaxID=2767888 RepID=UPI0021C274FF|nr:hypothetical protein [Liquorilactobacillus satsumensis]MCP9313825.1 hypothetical protein [Liquorilactobacillus satsumensis]MCP9360966.1 hypothetical protein [Liquorilactobacillus satsumensis]
MKTREELLKMYEADKLFFPKGSVLEDSYRNIYLLDILDVLKAPTEEQTKCNFCKNGYPSMKYQQFNFCPHCGKKLEASHE